MILIFGGKVGVAAMLVPKGLGPQNPNKKLALWIDLLDQPFPQNHGFKKFRLEPPSSSIYEYVIPQIPSEAAYNSII